MLLFIGLGNASVGFRKLLGFLAIALFCCQYYPAPVGSARSPLLSCPSLDRFGVETQAGGQAEAEGQQAGNLPSQVGRFAGRAQDPSPRFAGSGHLRR